MAENDRCLRSWRSQKPGEVRHEHTREVVREEKLPDWFAERLAAVEARIKLIEERPTPLVPKVPDNDASQVPRAFGDFFEKVIALEKTAATREDLDGLAQIVADIGNAALMQASIMAKRADALEARVSSLPSDLMREVGKAQFEMKHRRA